MEVNGVEDEKETVLGYIYFVICIFFKLTYL